MHHSNRHFLQKDRPIDHLRRHRSQRGLTSPWQDRATKLGQNYSSQPLQKFFVTTPVRLCGIARVERGCRECYFLRRSHCIGGQKYFWFQHRKHEVAFHRLANLPMQWQEHSRFLQDMHLPNQSRFDHERQPEDCPKSSQSVHHQPPRHERAFDGEDWVQVSNRGYQRCWVLSHRA